MASNILVRYYSLYFKFLIKPRQVILFKYHRGDNLPSLRYSGGVTKSAMFLLLAFKEDAEELENDETVLDNC